MKATGIVRRIDDLGRIVIPREIRRSMRIREGEPLEIFCDNMDGMVCFKKYTPFDEQDWLQAKNILHTIYPKLDFVLFDSNGERQTFYNNNTKSISLQPSEEIFHNPIKNKECDEIGYYRINTFLIKEDWNEQKFNDLLKAIFSKES